MGNKETFQEKIRQLGALAGELEALPVNGDSHVAAREAVQLLMEVHGTALRRMMEIIFESGASGEVILSRAGDDPVVRPILLLYSLHPDSIETRVLKAIDVAATRLRKFNSEVELLDICEGAVRVRISSSGHACGSTAKTVQSIVEECMYDQAPDLESLQILGHEDEASSGFVSIESLLKQPITAQTMAAD